MSIFLGMGVFSIFSIAVGLAMDACAVSIASGTSVQRVKLGGLLINRVEFLGGVILICIGFKILIEHL